MDNTQLLIDLKNEIAHKKEERARKEGEAQLIKKTLTDEFDVGTLEEVEKALTQLEKEEEKLQGELDTLEPEIKKGLEEIKWKM